MNPGDVVTIYQKPFTEEEPEGEATLIKCTKAEDGFWEGRVVQRWRVRFNGERETFERTILTLSYMGD